MQAARTGPQGVNALADIAVLLAVVPAPIVFDVGANIGQSVTTFRELLPSSIVHSFEPGPDAFRQLEVTTRGRVDVHLVNAGLGSVSGSQVLIERMSTHT
jgi:FkbM family methyltransferase